MRYHIDKLDSSLRQILNATFPGYKGRTFKVDTHIPERVHSYWDGGSKKEYAFFNLNTGKAVRLPDNHPLFNKIPNKVGTLPPHVIMVTHTTFCGKDHGITFHASEHQIKLIEPPKDELSLIEVMVLHYTARLKSSGRGIKNLRYHEAHEDYDVRKFIWSKAIDTLIEKKYLRKNKSISPKGRNVVERYPYRCGGCGSEKRGTFSSTVTFCTSCLIKLEEHTYKNS